MGKRQVIIETICKKTEFTAMNFCISIFSAVP